VSVADLRVVFVLVDHFTAALRSAHVAVQALGLRQNTSRWMLLHRAPLDPRLSSLTDREEKTE
jgi:hypothetical protein